MGMTRPGRFEVTVEDGGDRAHQRAPLFGHTDVAGVDLHEPHRLHGHQRVEFRFESFSHAKAGRCRGQVTLQGAHQAFDDGAPEPVVCSQFDAPNDREATVLDTPGISAERRPVLHVSLGKAADGRSAETEQDRRRGGGVALKITPQPPLVNRNCQRVVGPVKVEQKRGEYLERGDLVAEVHELRRVIAEISVSEKEIAAVHLGQPITLKARAFPGRSFTGRVTSIAPAASHSETYSGRQIIISTQLENPDLLLKPQMTGTAKIHCGERRGITLLTRRLVRYLRVEFWSWW